jgi:hypothetical protein
MRKRFFRSVVEEMGDEEIFWERWNLEAAGDTCLFWGNETVGPTFASRFLGIQGGDLLERALGTG